MGRLGWISASVILAASLVAPQVSNSVLAQNAPPAPAQTPPAAPEASRRAPPGYRRSRGALCVVGRLMRPW